MPLREIVPFLQKIELKKGDVIVCTSHEAMHALMGMQLPKELFPFDIPLVFAPDGLKKVGREELVALIDKLDGLEVEGGEGASI